MNILQICPTSPVICSLFTLGNPKKSFFNIIIHILQIITLSQKKTNRNCCTAALAVYFLLFSAYYYLHSPCTASGVRYRRSVCIDMDMLRLGQLLVATRTEFKHSVVYYAADQC